MYCACPEVLIAGYQVRTSNSRLRCTSVCSSVFVPTECAPVGGGSSKYDCPTATPGVAWTAVANSRDTANVALVNAEAISIGAAAAASTGTHRGLQFGGRNG